MNTVGPTVHAVGPLAIKLSNSAMAYNCGSFGQIPEQVLSEYNTCTWSSPFLQTKVANLAWVLQPPLLYPLIIDLSTEFVSTGEIGVRFVALTFILPDFCLCKEFE